MTYGQRVLLAVLQRTHLVDVAARCDVAPSRVSEWMSGIYRPSPRSRARLLANYGIPLAAWDQQWKRPTARAFRALS